MSINTKFFYPNVLSKIIIIANPKITPKVAKLEYFPFWDSGINSSTITKIIAPAANANKNGNKSPIKLDNKIVSALYENGEAAELHCTKKQDASAFELGNIYIGKVKNFKCF